VKHLLAAFPSPHVLTSAAYAGSYLDVVESYNVFLRNNFSDYNADTWGGVAAGGTVSTTGGFGFGTHNPNLAYTVIATLDFRTTGSGSINGNLYDGTAGGINANFAVNGTTINGKGNPATVPIDFADTFGKLGSLSASLGAMSANPGNGCRNSYNSIVCTAAASGLNIINIGAGTSQSANSGTANSYDIGNNYGIQLNVTDPNATVVVNVAGSGQRFTSGAGFAVSGVSYTHVLFNYYEAMSLVLGTSGVTASLLAPFADVNKLQSGGNFDGNFIAKSFYGGSELRH